MISSRLKPAEIMGDGNNSFDDEGDTYEYINYGREYHYDNSDDQEDNAGDKRYHGKTRSEDGNQTDYDEVNTHQVVENPGENHHHDTEDKRQDTYQPAAAQNTEDAEQYKGDAHQVVEYAGENQYEDAEE